MNSLKGTGTLMVFIRGLLKDTIKAYFLLTSYVVLDYALSRLFYLF